MYRLRIVLPIKRSRGKTYLNTLKRIISYNLELCLSKIESKETVFLELAFICYVHISATWNISKHFGDKGMNDNKERVWYDTAERWSKCCLFVMYTYRLRGIFQSTLEIRAWTTASNASNMTLSVAQSAVSIIFLVFRIDICFSICMGLYLSCQAKKIVLIWEIASINSF